ncbi:CDGP domain-containing protein [Mycobacteroides abscessus]
MMTRRKRATAITAAVAIPASVAMAFATPVSAGCEAGPFAQYCDGPVKADGTWDRCFTSAPQSFSGQYGQVAGFIPSTGRCYPVDPNAFPPTPIGQPQYHIYP